MAKKSEIEIAAAAEVPAVVEKKNYFEELYSVNVSEKTEKKEGLTYLSWAWAWAEVKKRFPDATYTIKRFGEACLPYIFDPKNGYMVFTEVTVNGITHEMWLPVMDGKNKAMKDVPWEYEVKIPGGSKIKKTVAPATMMDINKALMRCLTKNLAMHGLGLYIYAGEDLPEGMSDAEAKGIMDACTSVQQLNEAFRSLSDYGFAREKLIAWGEERKRALEHAAAGKEAA